MQFAEDVREQGAVGTALPLYQRDPEEGQLGDGRRGVAASGELVERASSGTRKGWDMG